MLSFVILRLVQTHALSLRCLIVELANVKLLDRVSLLLSLLLFSLHVDLSSLLAEVAGLSGLVASTLDDRLEDACSRQIQIWNVSQLLTVLV